MSAAKGHTAVRAQKRPRVSDGEVWQRLELFPTPPWATRALMLCVLPDMLQMKTCNGGRLWDPCAGLGHMADVLTEGGADVFRSDIHSYDGQTYDMLADATDSREMQVAGYKARADWIITNPPFSRAIDMLPHFLENAEHGVALLMRLPWVEGVRRYDRVFNTSHRPTLIAVFSERVGMCEGGYDPDCDTATCYAWFVWLKRPPEWLRASGSATIPMRLIPPGTRDKLTIDRDARLAAVHVPGFVPPSRRKRLAKAAMAGAAVHG